MVLEIMNSSYGLFAFLDENGNAVIPTSRPALHTTEDGIHLPLVVHRDTWSDNLWTRAMKQQRPLISNVPPTLPPDHLPLRRALVTPIVYHDTPIGYINLADKPCDYTREDADTMESIAGWIAPVLDARLQRDRKERARQDMEAQLRHSQKLDAIGTLAGGIAHDFNNILMSILGYADLAKMKAGKDSPLTGDLEEVIAAGNRAADLVRQILTFSRKSSEEKHPLYVDHLLKEALKFLRSSLPSTLEIRRDIQADLGPIHGNPTQIHQVIMNLCTNATQAMDEGPGIRPASLPRPPGARKLHPTVRGGYGMRHAPGNRGSDL